MSARSLIEFVWSYSGVGYVISVESMANFLAAKRFDHALPTRVELAEQLRAMARSLEAGDSPFSSYVEPDVCVSRGAAEAEIDRLAEHISRLQERGA